MAQPVHVGPGASGENGATWQVIPPVTSALSAKDIAMFRMPGGWEMIVILVIALLLFGKRLPDVARSMGKSIVEFKKGLKGMQDEMHKVNDEIDSEVDKAVAEQAKLESKPAETASTSSATNKNTHPVG